MPPDGRRVLYVDLLRLLATFQMVQGHTIDAVLATELRTGPGYDTWTWVRGLTSVAFLFAAGVSFHLATLLRPELPGLRHPVTRKRLRRGLWLLVVGYAMHTPIGQPSVEAALREFLIVDVLQCIGVVLVVLALLTGLAKHRGVVVASCAVATVALLGLSELTESLAATGPLVHRVFRNWVSHGGGSIFPVVPWGAYMFAGVVVGALASPDGARTAHALRVRRLVAMGLPLLAVGLGVPGPFGRLVQLGAVVLVRAALALVGARVGRLPSALEKLAGETLIIYVVHVLLLYGAVVGLGAVVGPTLGLAPTLAVTAVFLVGSVAVGLGWRRLKASF